MCVYSEDSENTRDARVGDHLMVHPFSHSKGLTELHRPGQIAVCMRNGFHVTFAEVPVKIQDNFNIAPDAPAVFLEGTPGTTLFDRLRFLNRSGQNIDVRLTHFPIGTQVYVESVGVDLPVEASIPAPSEVVTAPVAIRA